MSSSVVGAGAATAGAPPSSILLSLLNNPRHQRIVGASSSSSSNSSTFAPTSTSLTLLLDTFVQSNVPILREIALRCSLRAEPFLLICAQRPADVLTTGIPDRSLCHTHELSLPHLPQDGGDLNASTSELIHLIDKLKAFVATAQSSAPKAPLTVIIDSIEHLVDDFGFGTKGALLMIQRILQSLKPGSRLIVGAPSDSLSPQIDATISQLHSLAIWEGVPSTSHEHGPFTTVSIQPDQVLQYMQTEFGLEPPVTDEHARAELSASEQVGQAPESLLTPSASQQTDPRFWSMMDIVLKRGPSGSAASAGGWWSTAPREQRCRVEALGKRVALPGGKVSGARQSYRSCRACLSAKRRNRQGKVTQELLLCEMREGRLQLLPVDPMPPDQARYAPVEQAAGMKAPSAAKPHGSESHQDVVSQLPFNLSETQAQRERRADVSLPHVQNAGPPTGGRIIFQPESDDDPDEEEDGDDDF